MLLLLALLSAAVAFTPPAGWTAQGTSRALLDANDPARGELREFAMLGGTGDPDELSLLIKGMGVPAGAITPAGAETFAFEAGTALGRARFQLQTDGVRWMIVTVARQHSQTLDPDALLQAALPPAGLAFKQVSVVAPGSDGSVWGGAAAAPSGAAWIQGVEVEPWGHDADVAGLWTGNLMLNGVPTTINANFEAAGKVRVERRSDGRQPVLDEGTWATRKGRLRMDVPGGGDDLDYQRLGSTLQLRYFDATLTLYRK
jgi:hypothetical protein